MIFKEPKNWPNMHVGGQSLHAHESWAHSPWKVHVQISLKFKCQYTDYTWIGSRTGLMHEHRFLFVVVSTVFFVFFGIVIRLRVID